MPNNDEVKIAIIDDYIKVAETIAAYVRRMGLTPIIFTNPLKFLDALKETTFDIAITDIRMPEMDGLTLLKKVIKRSPNTQVIVVSAHADKKDAIAALKFGAYDFFEKPVSQDELVATLKRTLVFEEVCKERDELAEKLSLVSQQETKKWGIQALAGKSPVMKKVLDKIRLLQKTNKTNVLVLGESGTGKELIARAIHFGSDRSECPFVTVNCSAIPADLAESILFGHTKGSFTGATSDRKGQFEMADGGTLFLDEIGDMPQSVQTKLLRVLEDGVVIPIGKTAGSCVDVRIVSATNTDLEDRISKGKFREDLYHRLATYEINLPPLRERTGDIDLLVTHFVALLSDEMGVAVPKIDVKFIDALKKHHFSGNVRELKNILERAMIDAGGGELAAQHLHLRSCMPAVVTEEDPVTVPTSEREELPSDLKKAEAVLVQRALDKAHGNVAEASRLLGISRAKIYRIIG